MRTAGSSFIAGRNGWSGAVAVLCVLGAAAVLGSRAEAQVVGGEPGEVPIGAFTIGNSHNGFSVVEPPAGVPEADRNTDNGSSWFFQRWEQSGQPADNAEGLYQEAMQALGDGRIEDAQRLFERLIASSPRSVRAGEARQHLGRLYSQVETGTTAAGAESQRAVATPGMSSPLDPTVLQRSRVAVSLDGQFLADAGDRIFFSVGSAALGARARGVVQAQARFLKQRPELSVAVEGHSDDGAMPDAELLGLSEQRAAVVRERLIAEGIDAGRILAYGRGREQRVSDCPQPECSAQNRRVVTILLNGRIADLKPSRRADRERSSDAVSPTQ